MHDTVASGWPPWYRFQMLGARNLADTFLATAALAATARALGLPNSRFSGASTANMLEPQGTHVCCGAPPGLCPCGPGVRSALLKMATKKYAVADRRVQQKKRVSRVTSSASRNSGSALSNLSWVCSSEASVTRVKTMLAGHLCARPGAVHSEARRSAHRGTRPCTGRSGRPRPPSGSCAAIARGSACGSTWRSRGTRRAARAGHRLHPPSIAVSRHVLSPLQYAIAWPGCENARPSREANLTIA